MTTPTTEQEIQAKGKTAPRVTPHALEENIVKEVYFTAADGMAGAWRNGDGPNQGSVNTEHELLTFCVLTLRNGFTVTGESACVSPENFDSEIGKKIARNNAVDKVWPLMGYELRSKLATIDDNDFQLGKACDLSGEGTCEACQ